MKNFYTMLLAVFLTLGMMVSAQAANSKKLVVLGYVEWDCATATTHLAKAALEDRLGVRVDAMPVSTAALWMGVSIGDVDGMLTAWLPNTNKDYAEKLKGKFEDLGPLVDGARLGFVVPSYVTISSVEELNASADKFNGQIIGIDAGASTMRLAEEAIKTYKLDKMRLIDGSGATMTASLADAIRQKKWIVVIGWSPHWMFGRWDLKYLDDPKDTMGGEESIHAIARLGLKKDRPEIHAFLDKFHYENTAQLETLMAWNQEKGADLMANARRFMKENPELVESWFAE